MERVFIGDAARLVTINHQHSQHQSRYRNCQKNAVDYTKIELERSFESWPYTMLMYCNVVYYVSYIVMYISLCICFNFKKYMNTEAMLHIHFQIYYFNNKAIILRLYYWWSIVSSYMYNMWMSIEIENMDLNCLSVNWPVPTDLTVLILG